MKRKSDISVILPSDLYHDLMDLIGRYSRACSLDFDRTIYAVLQGACSMYVDQISFKKQKKVFLLQGDNHYVLFDEQSTLQKHREFVQEASRDEYVVFRLNRKRARLINLVNLIILGSRLRNEEEAIFLALINFNFLLFHLRLGYIKLLVDEDMKKKTNITFPFEENSFFMRCRRLDHLN